MRSPVLAFGLIIAIASGGYAFADPQPLTRADCDKASMTWDSSGNVCGANKDRADSNAAGAPEAKTESNKAAAAQKGEAKPEKAKKHGGKKGKKGKGGKTVVKKVNGDTVVKKVTTKKGTTVTVTTKNASKKEQRKFFKWLHRQDKKS